MKRPRLWLFDGCECRPNYAGCHHEDAFFGGMMAALILVTGLLVVIC